MKLAWPCVYFNNTVKDGKNSNQLNYSQPSCVECTLISQPKLNIKISKKQRIRRLYLASLHPQLLGKMRIGKRMNMTYGVLLQATHMGSWS